MSEFKLLIFVTIFIYISLTVSAMVVLHLGITLFQFIEDYKEVKL
jgi:hypothetical protein